MVSVFHCFTAFASSCLLVPTMTASNQEGKGDWCGTKGRLEPC